MIKDCKVLLCVAIYIRIQPFKSKLKMRLSGLIFLCFFILSQNSTKAQVYADSQASGANGLCVGCNVLDPQNAVDTNLSNYSVLNLTDSVSGAYAYQTFNFSSPGNAGDYVGMIVEDISLLGLDATLLGGTELTTFNTNVSNNDSKNSSLFSISLFGGSSSKYLIEFQAGVTFDAVELKFNAGIAGALYNLRIYSVYHNSTPLPIELINFTATVLDKNVELNWFTASETNNDYFTVEQSTDGINFNNIGTVDGAGNSIMLKKYSFTHASPKEGTLYYRLKQTDMDGQSVYFKMISATVQNNDFSLMLYPNPLFEGSIHLNCNSPIDLEIAIFDELGEVVYSGNIKTKDGVFVYDIPLEEKLFSGIYFVSVTSGKTLKTERLVIMNQ